MDDRSAHFQTLICDVCERAQLGGHPVSLRLRDGTELDGRPVPVPEPVAEPLDDTGYGDVIDVDGRHVALADVAEATIRLG